MQGFSESKFPASDKTEKKKNQIKVLKKRKNLVNSLGTGVTASNWQC